MGLAVACCLPAAPRTASAYTPYCTWHLFLFRGGDAAPAADESIGAFGPATAAIAPGACADGWQDPDPALDVPESGGEDGAWDLGRGTNGHIRIAVPVGNLAAKPDFVAYQVELMVNVVAYECDGLVALPSLHVADAWAETGSRSDTDAFADPVLGVWRNRTWNLTVHSLKDDVLVLTIAADPALDSTVDTIEIYAWTTPVAEPLYTSLGTPIAWFRDSGIEPAAGRDWDDADHEDADGDGSLNWQEYVAGTDPGDPGSLLKIVVLRAVLGEPLHIEWIGGIRGPLAPYVIQASPGLREPGWQALGTRERVAGTNDWTGPVVDLPPCRFYRILAPRDENP